VKDKENAYDIWNTLFKTFARKSMATQLFLRKRFLLLKFNSAKDSLSNHFLIFDKLIRELKARFKIRMDF